MSRTLLKGFIICALCSFFAAFAELPNATRNDQYPLFSSWYPYDFLSSRQKAQLMRFDYTYVPERFRISISGYGQFANRARNNRGNVINIGDINGRWNMLGLFYDPVMRERLFSVLGIGLTQPPATTCQDNPEAVPTGDADQAGSFCFNIITDPKLVDPNKEFGFFSIPAVYKKFGVRFESEILLIDRCFYAVGLKAQWGISDVRQTVHAFEDFTGQALGQAAPANPPGVTAGTSSPPVVPFTGITPPYVDPANIPPCPQGGTANNPNEILNCVEPLQPFAPCQTQVVCLSFSGACKRFVIENIMKQRTKITDVLDIDTNNYHKIGLDDLRLILYYRHIYVINEDDERYARVLFMPFLEAGVGIPMEKYQPLYKPFAVPIGNNNHPYVGATGGYTVDFLDTIDLSFSSGFSYFFPHEYCNFRLPTNTAESGIFPYTADVNIRPGITWYFNVGLHAWHFLDNLSVWAEYVYVSHAQDRIDVCRSFIPSNSCYFATGFRVEDAEALSKWESQLFNIGFNYDISDNFSLGALWQAPIRERNAYRQGTIMGTLSAVF